MSDAHPRVQATRTIYQGRVFDVAVDTVLLPQGRAVDMEVVRHPGSVVLLPMPARDRILLVRQYRYVVDRWLWELPAGTLEPGETPARGAARECHEEIGRIPGRVEPLGTFYPSPGFCDEAMTFFRLSDLREPLPTDAAAAHDEDELLQIGEFSVTEAREMVHSGMIIDMKTAFGLVLIL